MPVHSSAISTPEILPRQLRRVALRRHLHRPEAGVDGVAGDLHLVRELAVHRVAAKQVGVGLHRPEVVDRDDLDVLATRFQNGSEDQAADAAKSIDCDAYRHHLLLLKFAARLPADLISGVP